MKTFSSRMVAIFCISLLAACTTTGDFYDESKHAEEDFSTGNTALAVLGAAAAIYLVAQSGGSGGGYGSSSLSVTDTDWDWDYLPASNQWACRGIQTGQFAEPYRCAGDIRMDVRWPG